MLLQKKISLWVSILLILSLLLSACAKDTEESDKPATGTVSHTVTFDPKNGTPSSSIKVIDGLTIPEPTPPTREDSYFEGWYHNGKKWDFTKTLYEDVTLVAKWSDPSNYFEIKTDPITLEATVVSVKSKDTLTRLTVPSVIDGFTVTAIGDSVFEDFAMRGVEKITLPSTIRSVGAYAFKGCTGVLIDLSNAVLTEIGEEAFRDCDRLSAVMLGEGLTEIPEFTFMNCSSLSFVYFPSTLLGIGESAFDGCEQLSILLMPASVQQIEHGAFSDCKSLSTLFYGGNREEFDLLLSHTDHGSNQEFISLQDSVILYSETEPTENGDFWHYDDTHAPTLW